MALILTVLQIVRLPNIKVRCFQNEDTSSFKEERNLKVNQQKYEYWHLFDTHNSQF